jgi:hypothetical protein
VLLRALASFKPGELRALRVRDRRFIDDLAVFLQLVPLASTAVARMGVTRGVSMEEADAACRRRHDDAPLLVAVSGALQSVQSLAWDGVVHDKDMHGETAFLRRYAATLTEVDCWMVTRNGRAPLSVCAALSLCMQLESLSCAGCYTPIAWLGLSQLHTLRGVSLDAVPVSAIAAALPCLHTLAASLQASDPAAVAGFFDHLLPRLRSFGFSGGWPQDEHGDDAHTCELPPPPFPFLEQLSWNLYYAGGDAAFRCFSNARPHKLSAPCGGVTEWLDGTSTACGALCPPGGVLPSKGPLSLVLELEVDGAVDVARLLHAAPELRRLTVNNWVGDSTYWCTGVGPVDAGFGGLRHTLRSLDVTMRSEKGRPPCAPPADCAKRLRQQHFPRLRNLKINRVDYTDLPVD